MMYALIIFASTTIVISGYDSKDSCEAAANAFTTAIPTSYRTGTARCIPVPSNAIVVAR